MAERLFKTKAGHTIPLPAFVQSYDDAEAYARLMAPEAFVVPEEQGFLGEAADTFNRGLQDAQINLNILADEAGIISPETSQAWIAENMAEKAATPQDPEKTAALQTIMDPENSWGAAARAALDNPGLLPDVLIESMAGSLPELAATAGGAAMGTLVGGPVGGAIGAGAGAFAGGAPLEFARTISETAQETGYDLSDPEQYAAFFADEETMALARDKGAKRGIAIGAFNALSAGMAGRILRAGETAIDVAEEAGQALSKGQKRVRRAGAGTAEAVAQAGTGAGGEAAAQVLSEGEITNRGAVIIEGVADLGSGAGEIAIGTFSSRPSKIQGGKDDTPPADAPPIEGAQEQQAKPLQLTYDPNVGAAPSGVAPEVRNSEVSQVRDNLTTAVRDAGMPPIRQQPMPKAAKISKPTDGVYQVENLMTPDAQPISITKSATDGGTSYNVMGQSFPKLSEAKSFLNTQIEGGGVQPMSTTAQVNKITSSVNREIAKQFGQMDKAPSQTEMDNMVRRVAGGDNVADVVSFTMGDVRLPSGEMNSTIEAYREKPAQIINAARERNLNLRELGIDPVTLSAPQLEAAYETIKKAQPVSTQPDARPEGQRLFTDPVTLPEGYTVAREAAPTKDGKGVIREIIRAPNRQTVESRPVQTFDDIGAARKTLYENVRLEELEGKVAQLEQAIPTQQQVVQDVEAQVGSSLARSQRKPKDKAVQQELETRREKLTQARAKLDDYNENAAIAAAEAVRRGEQQLANRILPNSEVESATRSGSQELLDKFVGQFMRDKAKAMGLDEAGVKVEIASLPREAEGSYSPTKKLMRVGTEGLLQFYRKKNVTREEIRSYLAGVIDHEAIHALVQLGKIDGETLATLQKMVGQSQRADPVTGKKRVDANGEPETWLAAARRMYEGRGLTEEALVEEAIAEAFRAYNLGNLKSLSGKPKGVFERIVDMFRRMMNGMVRRPDVMKASKEFFDSINSGEAVKAASDRPVTPNTEPLVFSLRDTDSVFAVTQVTTTDLNDVIETKYTDMLKGRIDIAFEKKRKRDPNIPMFDLQSVEPRAFVRSTYQTMNEEKAGNIDILVFDSNLGRFGFIDWFGNDPQDAAATSAKKARALEKRAKAEGRSTEAQRHAQDARDYEALAKERRLGDGEIMLLMRMAGHQIGDLDALIGYRISGTKDAQRKLESLAEDDPMNMQYVPARKLGKKFDTATLKAGLATYVDDGGDLAALDTAPLIKYLEETGDWQDSTFRRKLAEEVYLAVDDPAALDAKLKALEGGMTGESGEADFADIAIAQMEAAGYDTNDPDEMYSLAADYERSAKGTTIQNQEPTGDPISDNLIGKITHETLMDQITEYRQTGGWERLRTTVRQKIVDSAAGIGSIAYKLGNYAPELKAQVVEMSSVNAIRMLGSAKGINEQVVQRGYLKVVKTPDGGTTLRIVDTDADGNKLMSIDDILKRIWNMKKEESFQKFLMARRHDYIEAKRMTQLPRFKAWEDAGKPRGEKPYMTPPSGFTDEQVQAMYADIGRQDDATIAEFKEMAAGLNVIMTGNAQAMYDAGIISEQEREVFADSFYVPFYKMTEEQEAGGSAGRMQFMREHEGEVKKHARRKGTSKEKSPIAPLIQSLIQNTERTVTQILKNDAYTKSVRDMLDYSKIGKFNAGNLIKEVTKDGKNTVTILRDGEPVYYQINDPLYYESITAAGKSARSPMNPLLGIPIRALRYSVTNSPPFILANLIRDSVSAWVLSGEKITPVASTFKMFYRALRHGEDDPLVKAVREGGIGLGYDNQLAERSLIKKYTGEQYGNIPVIRQLRMAMGGLERASAASDIASRMAIYEAVIKRGGSPAEAVAGARELINYGRRGSNEFVAGMIATIPFLNARLQGLDVLQRTLLGYGNDKGADGNAGQRQTRMLMRMSLLIGASSAYVMSVSGEDWYEEQAPEVRDNNYLIWTPAGVIAIPIAFEIGTLTKTIPELIIRNQFLGDEDSRSVWRSVKSIVQATFMADPTPQVLRPYLEVVSNYSKFRQREIIPRSMENLKASEQYNDRTSQFSIAVGQMADTLGIPISPIKLDYLISGYGGTMGTYALNTVDYAAKKVGVDTGPAMGVTDYPVVRRFLKSPEGYGALTDFYDMKNAVDTVYATVSELQDRGQYAKALKLQKDNARLLQSRGQVNAMYQNIRNVQQQINTIRENTRMTPEQQRDRIKQLEIIRNKYLKNIGKMRERVFN